MLKSMYEFLEVTMGGVITWYRAARWLYLHKLTPMAVIIKSAIRILWGSVIPFQAEIGEGTFITYHGLGVVINKQAVIGKNCRIRQHVTIAGDGDGVPVIGDEVQIGAGAILIGKIHIGNHVRIGANAVVLHDLPDNCTAVGMPAKPVKFHEV